MNNDNNKNKQSLSIIRTIVILELVWLLLYFLGAYPGNQREAVAEDEETEAETVAEEAEKVVEVTSDLPADIASKPGLEKIVLDENISVVYIYDVAYVVYESGYGAGHSVAISPMYDSDGNIMTKEKNNEK